LKNRVPLAPIPAKITHGANWNQQAVSLLTGNPGSLPGGRIGARIKSFP